MKKTAAVLYSLLSFYVVTKLIRSSNKNGANYYFRLFTIFAS